MNSIGVYVSPWYQAPINGLPRSQFVIGDVHGCSSELHGLLSVMKSKVEKEADLTFLGDLIDRGPNSLECLQIASQPEGFKEVHYLLGNHEAMFSSSCLPGLEAAMAFNIWLRNGGDKVLEEFSPQAYEIAVKNRAVVMDYLFENFPQRIKDMFGKMRVYRTVGNLLLVHAGVNPRAPNLQQWLDDADPFNFIDDSPLWIRDPFLRHQGAFESNKIVIHGHSIEPNVIDMLGLPQSNAHKMVGSRLNLDGGSFLTGVVVGAEFQTNRYRIFKAKQQVQE